MMKPIVGLAFIICIAFVSCYEINENAVLKNGARRNLIGDLIGSVTGTRDGMWDLLKYFTMCEIRCRGKNCECCQRLDLAFLHAKVCITSQVDPSDKSVTLGMEAGSFTFLKLKVSIGKYLYYCKDSSYGKVCINTILRDADNGPELTVCSSITFSIKEVNTLQINTNCFTLDGDLILTGPLTEEGKSIGFVKVVSPFQFFNLIRKLAGFGG